MMSDAPNTPDNQNEPVENAVLSERKKTALLRYMSILFGVAFLLVLLSFLIQARDSRETISDLNQSNASALQNAVQLQNENRALLEENQKINAELSELHEDFETVSDAYANATEEIIEGTQERSELVGQISEADAVLGKTVLTYDALLAAQAALDADDTDALTDALEVLSKNKAYLSAEAAAHYEILLGSLTAEVPNEE